MVKAGIALPGEQGVAGIHDPGFEKLQSEQVWRMASKHLRLTCSAKPTESRVKQQKLTKEKALHDDIKEIAENLQLSDAKGALPKRRP